MMRKLLMSMACAAMLLSGSVGHAQGGEARFIWRPQTLGVIKNTYMNGPIEDQQPVLMPIADQFLVVGKPMELGLIVSSNKTGMRWPYDQLSFIVTGLPTGLALDSATGRITGSSTGEVNAVTVTVTVTVTGKTPAMRTFKITVSDPNAPISLASGTKLDYAVAQSDNALVVSTTPNFLHANGPIAFSKVSSSSPKLSVDPQTGWIYASGGTKTLTEGAHSIHVLAKDKDGKWVGYTYNITVDPAFVDVRVTDKSIYPGTQVEIPSTYSVAPGVPMERRVYYIAGLPPGLDFDPATGNVTGVVSNAYQGKDFDVIVTVTDRETGASGSATYKLSIYKAGHRYWRWRAFEWSLPGRVSIADIAFLDGDWQAMTPLAKTHSLGSTGLSLAFDGNATTYWYYEAGAGVTRVNPYPTTNKAAIHVDFGTPKLVKGVDLTRYNRPGNNFDAPLGWTVEWSDDSLIGPWTTAWTESREPIAWQSDPNPVWRTAPDEN